MTSNLTLSARSNLDNSSSAFILHTVDSAGNRTTVIPRTILNLAVQSFELTVPPTSKLSFSVFENNIAKVQDPNISVLDLTYTYIPEGQTEPVSVDLRDTVQVFRGDVLSADRTAWCQKTHSTFYWGSPMSWNRSNFTYVYSLPV